ncbi:hypothetical protein PSN45_002362 [Yamadazyma tenuis]|uniref:Clavaminate synthase-like protein n=1 Tax=Candida tenuis (strain ATCC 10573 / BCRC 21748 / CBS 615 / JCM 9827 / NBRC 10315 / NRRL Y-1498 / VKM Y-70) TaxID=590646 RepID=G3B0R7_CANTC|nr:Clavaminate synthase-like protein [Yamadazyma tenuis ATCC 10573]EGV65459.1 Clavaminate synthase-like protein [Yamadazyma tenuis ATCC 10573]WEJ94862.1 hypothetical protein PSN45_002362 [Yamadazyma tenuis]
MPELVKINLPNTHIVNGNEFPVAFDLQAADTFKENSDKVAAFLSKTAKSQFFNNALAKHGAVVIRNTGTIDPDTIGKYIAAIGTGSGDEFFEQHGSTAQRTEITNYLSTANEGPSSTYIHQHNEFSRFTKYPTRLFFVCTKMGKETKGGETPIVHGAEFFNKLQENVPDLVDSLSKRGLLYEQTWNFTSQTKTSWWDYFCFGREITKEDTLEVRKQKAAISVAANVSKDFSWGDDNSLEVYQHTDPIRVHTDPTTGKKNPTVFCSIATYYHTSKDANANTPTKPLMYDDNHEIIDEKLLEKAFQIAFDVSYEHQWQEGDIAIVDNYQVSHGRCPWSDGPRTILVSMWDTPGKPEYPAWKPSAL